MVSTALQFFKIFVPAPMELETKGAEYVCIDCGQATVLKPRDSVRCSHCGKSILYKARNRSSPVQLLAL